MAQTLPAPAETIAVATPVRPPAGRARVHFRMARTVVALMLREISTRYGRSPGGYLWEVAEPIAGIALLSFVFSLTFRTPAIGTNFALFYASGFLPFSIYLDLSSKIAKSLSFSRPFLQYPAVTFVDTIIARLLLNVMTQVTVIVLILGGIDVIYGLNINWNFAALAAGLGMVVVLAAGVGMMNAYLFLEFPVWERAWSILTRPLFLLSGVFYLYSHMPAGAQKILWFNPLLHVVAMFRKGIYGTYNADYASPLYVVSVGIVLTFFGLLLLRRHHQRLLEK